jgi:hypothetical protein
VIDDEVVALDLDRTPDVALRPTERRTLPDRVRVLDPGVARFSIAYGSNASPLRLVDKGLTVGGAVLLPAVVRGWVPAFEARRTGYGAVPLTLVAAPGVVTETWVLGLPPEALPELDRTEGRLPDGPPATREPDDADPRRAPPGTYQLGPIGDVEVAGRWVLRDALAYLPGPWTQVQITDEGGWRTWPEHDQAAAAAHIDADGPSAPAPAVVAPHLGPWPETPLIPFP